MKKHSLQRTSGSARWMATASVALVLSGSFGCQLCCPPYMDDYATIGGKWARSHPTEGTVGSAFNDPGQMHLALPLHDRPTPAQDESNYAPLEEGIEEVIEEPLVPEVPSILRESRQSGIIILE